MNGAFYIVLHCVLHCLHLKFLVFRLVDMAIFNASDVNADDKLLVLGAQLGDSIEVACVWLVQPKINPKDN